MKKKIEVKISKKTNRTNNALFICAIIFSILFLAIPILLKLPCLQNLIKLFLNRMGPYKASYFEACGAMIGSFLAVISAIWIQNRSEAKQRNDAIKKYATIVYFDIDKFYRENDIFASRVIDLHQSYAQHKKSKEYIIKKFEQWRQYASIFIDHEWISTVAELGVVFDKTTIDNIYGFYGKVEYIKGKLNSITELSCDDIKMIVTQLHDIGEKKPSYKANQTILDILNELNDLIVSLN